MAAVLQLGARPGPGADATKPSGYRVVGLVVALIGLMGAMAATIGNLVAAAGIDEEATFGETLAWTFGLTTLSFGTVKIGIAIILMGIIVRLWLRVDSMKTSLARLHGHGESAPSVRGTVETDFGPTSITDDMPEPLPIHRLARFMWRPSLVMGAMALVLGFIISLVWASETAGTESAREAAALTQGIEFLGETFPLSGIAFLLGTILAGLREGGGEVQSSLGIPVTTLKMPATAKAFVGLMMLGMMAGIVQFILYLAAFAVADDPASFSSWSNWLDPFRELSLGLILAGIVLALVTIGNVLGFQFDRVKSIIRNGH